jgi:outer membrane lipoprotein-sorting protein
MSLRLVLLAAFASVSFSMPVAAETPQEKGLSIFKEAEKRNEGFVDSVASVRMVLRDKKGDTAERLIKVKSLEGQGSDGDKTLMVFETPKDQKGTALLTWQQATRDDDQWLYLPALKRVKKIASKSKSGPFMGSEFSFEDVGGQQVDDYNYTWLRDETLDGQECFVVEAIPKDGNSGYTRIVSWMDKQHYRTLRSEFYDRKNTLLKTLTAHDFSLHAGKFWRAAKAEMKNAQTGKSTDLLTDTLSFGNGLSASDFTQNSLQRAR